jgi:hypothetical protein
MYVKKHLCLSTFRRADEWREPCPEDATRRSLRDWKKSNITIPEARSAEVVAVYWRVFGRPPYRIGRSSPFKNDGTPVFSLCEMRFLQTLVPQLEDRREIFEQEYPPRETWVGEWGPRAYDFASVGD